METNKMELLQKIRREYHQLIIDNHLTVPKDNKNGTNPVRAITEMLDEVIRNV